MNTSTDRSYLAPKAIFVPGTIPRMNFERGMVFTLWLREILRLKREPARWIGIVAQPILFWLILGKGLGAGWKIPGVKIGYAQYFYPGILFMISFLFSPRKMPRCHNYCVYSNNRFSFPSTMGRLPNQSDLLGSIGRCFIP